MITYPTDKLQKVLLSGATEQRNLPDGYTQVEYIENDGNQYLQGNISGLTDSAEIEIDVYSYNYTADGGFFCLYNSTSTDRAFFTGYGFQNSIYVASYPTNGYSVASGRAVAGNHTIERKGNGDIYVDGSKITNVQQTATWTSFANITSFLVGRSSLSGIIFPARYKRITIKNKLDLIPARRNSDNVLGMYDLVSGQFFTNAGTGTFTAGADVIPSPDTPMDIVSNNGALKPRHQSGLPLGYTLLDYIESTGTQYIDTGYIAKENTIVDIDFKSNKTSGEPFTCLFGSQKSGADNGRFYVLFGSTQTVQLNIPRQSIGPGYLASDGTVSDSPTGITPYFTNDRTHYIANVANKTLKIKNITWDASVLFTESYVAPTNSIYLLTRNTNNTAESNCSKGLLYGCVIKEDNVTVVNLIPAKRNSDNVLGMYDTVSGTFFTNAGTGTITAGTAVSDPVEIYTEGTVETIQDNLGNTATAEMLLKVDNYQDVQSVLDGVVTRKIGIKVLDGTENWIKGAMSMYADGLVADSADQTSGIICFCTHYKGIASNAPVTDNTNTNSIKVYNTSSVNRIIALVVMNDYATAQDFTDFLADQYNAGTPVIIVYPLATPTIEQVTPQSLAGNSVTQTAGSIDNLPIESSTIAELKKRYIGDNEVKRVYIGDNLVHLHLSDDTKFMKRITCNGEINEDVDVNCLIEEIRGKSIVWNQIAAKTIKASPYYTYENNKITILRSAPKNFNETRYEFANFVKGHRYFLHKVSNAPLEIHNYYGGDKVMSAADTIKLYSKNYNWKFTLGYSSDAEVGTYDAYINVIDLTLMFGAGKEPKTTAEFIEMFPLDYYDYNAGEVIPFAGQNLTTTGKNQYNPATGKANLLGGQQYQIGGTYTKLYPTATLVDYTYGSPVVSGTYYTNANSHYVGARAVSAYDNTKTYALGAYCVYDNAVYKANVAIETAEEFDATHWDVIADVAAMVAEGILTLWDITPDANGLFTLTKDTEVTIVGGNDTDTIVALYNGETNTYEPYEKHTLPLDPSQWRDKQGNLVFPYGGMHSVGTTYDYANVDADGYIRNAVRVFERRAYESGDTELANVITDGSTYTIYSLATPIEVELATPVYAKYLANGLGTEEISPANTSTPTTTPANMTIDYRLCTE